MVAWTKKKAKSALKNIHNYIKIDSPYYAKEVKKQFIKESKRLQTFPQLGRVVPELANESIRELFIYSYRMIYEISDNNIYIITIVHSKQNFNTIEK